MTEQQLPGIEHRPGADIVPHRAPTRSTSVRPAQRAGQPPWWRLDDDTKRIGREGVARARQALEEARQRALRHDHPAAA